MAHHAFISGYKTFGLEFTDNDIQLMTAAWAARGYVVTSPAPTTRHRSPKSAFTGAIDSLMDAVDRKDTLVVYYSGHAFIQSNGDPYLVLDSYTTSNEHRSTIALSQVIDSIARSRARNRLLILDCCHALPSTVKWQLPDSEGLRILAASGRLERAKESADLQSSTMTNSIHDALTASYYDAARGGDQLTVNLLHSWVAARARQCNQMNTNRVPTPRLLGDAGDDYVICLSGGSPWPSTIRTYVRQLNSCFSKPGSGCYGRYSWCRPVNELGHGSHLYVVPRLRTSASGQPIREDRLDHFFSSWLKSTDSAQLAILGDSGCGKSSACVYLAMKVVESWDQMDPTSLIPVIISLESLARRSLLHSDVARILEAEAGVNADKEVIDSLVARQRFLFLLDGLDEIVVHGDQSSIEQALDALEPLLRSGCRTVLTCRTHLFVNQHQVDDVLSGGTRVGTELYAALANAAPGIFQVAELQEFSRIEVRDAIARRSPDSVDQAISIIEGLYNLEDLARRPLLLVLILRTLPELAKRKARINRAEIYEAYTRYWLLREAKRSSVRYRTSEIHRFIHVLAKQMWGIKRQVIHYRQLQSTAPSILRNINLGKGDLIDFDHVVRVATFLNRDRRGRFRFMHRSFMEYFVAEACVREVRRDGRGMNTWNTRWFDKEVASFVAELLAITKYRKKIGGLIQVGITSSKPITLWNVLHVLSLVDHDLFLEHAGERFVDSAVARADREGTAVLLRQYCRIVARFGAQQEASRLIDRLVGIVRKNDAQNRDNNETYINYYYGRNSACDALLRHIARNPPTYDRCLHIYVLGEIGDQEHATTLRDLSERWTSERHRELAREAEEKIRLRAM